MPIYKGFIHKGYIQEDTVNTLFLLYGASCQTTVTGNISGSNTVLNARFKDGLGVAYLLDSVKVEFMYQSPIDRNGTFKFKLAVLPPSSIDYYVVITTAEFNTHFIRSSKKDYGNQQINRPIKRNTDNTFNYTLDDETSDGYDLKEYGTYWHAKKKITLSAGDVSVSIDPSEGSEDGLGFSSESLADAAKIPANIDYGGHGNFSVVCIDSKYWLCTKTHKSKSGDNGNKPKIGKKWKKYWMRCPSKYEGMSEKWKNETKYYGYNSESTETESNKHLLCKLH